jgi:hypothetical protein
MFESIAWYACALAGAIYVLSPLVVQSGSRFASRCQPEAISPDRLPEVIATEFRRRIPEFANLGFELVGCFDCGVLVNGARSYLAYFCNPTTNEFANVSAMTTPNGPASYFEFSARFRMATASRPTTTRCCRFCRQIRMSGYSVSQQSRNRARCCRFIGNSRRNTRLGCARRASHGMPRFSGMRA